MSYAKPELLTLSSAGAARVVRNTGRDGRGGGTQDDAKSWWIGEAGESGDDTGGRGDGIVPTSSSGSAYEADE